jgi:hypothetical protein
MDSMLRAASQYVGPLECPESGAAYPTLYAGTSRDVRALVPNSSASLERAAAISRSLMSLHPFSPQIRTQNSSFAVAVGATSAASATSETITTRVRLTPDVRSRRAAGSVLRGGRSLTWASVPKCHPSWLDNDDWLSLLAVPPRPCVPHDAQPAVLPDVRLSKPLRCRAFQSVKRALNLTRKGAQIDLACVCGCRKSSISTRSEDAKCRLSAEAMGC